MSRLSPLLTHLSAIFPAPIKQTLAKLSPPLLAESDMDLKVGTDEEAENHRLLISCPPVEADDRLNMRSVETTAGQV